MVLGWEIHWTCQWTRKNKEWIWGCRKPKRAGGEDGRFAVAGVRALVCNRFHSAILAVSIVDGHCLPLVHFFFRYTGTVAAEVSAELETLRGKWRGMKSSTRHHLRPELQRLVLRVGVRYRVHSACAVNVVDMHRAQLTVVYVVLDYSKRPQITDW